MTFTTRTIGIASGKGGVGKTTVVANLGVALARRKKRVLLVDANLTASTLGYQLNLISPESTVQDVLNGRTQAGLSVYEVAGVHVIPSAIYIDEPADAARLADAINSIIGNYDFVLIDGPAGAGSDIDALINSSTEVLVVANPDVMSLAAAIKVIHRSRNMGKHVTGLVLNRLRHEKNELGQKDVEALCEVPVVASIPEDGKIRESLARHIPVVVYDPDSPSSLAFERLAASLTSEQYLEPPLFEILIHSLIRSIGYRTQQQHPPELSATKLAPPTMLSSLPRPQLGEQSPQQQQQQQKHQPLEDITDDDNNAGTQKKEFIHDDD